MESKKWEYKENFHKIPMSDDYDGHYEVTNGDISLCTSDDPEDITETENTLQRVANALNESGCKFYCDTTTEHKLHIENMELTYKIDDLRDQAQRMADALNTIGNGPFPVTQKELEEWLLKTKSMAREAFQQFKYGVKEAEQRHEGWPWVCEYCGKQDCGSDHK